MAALMIPQELLDYLDVQAARAWAWGECDCTVGLVSDWIRLRRGIDPAAPYRARYSSPEAARALVIEQGGFVPLIGHILDEAGLERTGAPISGDIGVIDVDLGERQSMPVVGGVMGIRIGDLWVTRALHGLRYRAFPFAQAWRV
jgi:hypothetical protein